MSSIFQKLNLKNQPEILVVNAPASFEPAIAALEGVLVQRDVEAVERVVFALAFVTRLAEAESLARRIAAKTEGDALVWFAYPKGGSKRYKSEVTRDAGWAVLGEQGFEAVRQIAIDEAWSALRFRRTEYIRTMRRDPVRALSAQGRRRVNAEVGEG